MSGDLTRHRQQAVNVQVKYREQIAAVRADQDLSDEGRQRRLAQIFRDTQAKLDGFAAAERRDLETRWTSLTSQLYGADRFSSDPASHAISMRDASDRAAQLKSPQEAARLMRDAEASGDRVLAKAIFRRIGEQEPTGRRGVDEAWEAIGRDYLDRHGEAARLVDQLAEIETMRTRQVFSPFTAQRPHEVAPQFINNAAAGEAAVPA